tara:strand:- start:930 stop:1391 length:462 start_codon:yes stop_codon:yes gene_type:complete
MVHRRTFISWRIAHQETMSSMSNHSAKKIKIKSQCKKTATKISRMIQNQPASLTCSRIANEGHVICFTRYSKKWRRSFRLATAALKEKNGEGWFRAVYRRGLIEPLVSVRMSQPFGFVLQTAQMNHTIPAINKNPSTASPLLDSDAVPAASNG